MASEVRDRRNLESDVMGVPKDRILLAAFVTTTLGESPGGNEQAADETRVIRQ